MRSVGLGFGDDQPVVTRPADFLLSPWVLASIVVLVVNDHVLKWTFGGWLTGKVSDVAGVFLLPFLILAIYEAARKPFTPRWRTTAVEAAIVCGVVGFGFAAVKTIGPVGDAYEYMVGLLRTVVTASSGPVTPILVYRDATDLVVLPILAATYLVWRRHRGEPRPEGDPYPRSISATRKASSSDC